MEDSLVLSEETYEVDHVKHSVGGLGGHIFRRGIHLGLGVVPLLYYWHGESIAGIINMTPTELILGVLGVIIVAELVRLKFGITIVGQRAYEAKQLSALFWGAISVCGALLLAPELGVMGAALGAPLIWGLTFGDPAMGEARRAGWEPRMVFGAGLVVVSLVWLSAWYFLSTPLLFALLIAPIQVASEWPRLRWIDDNGTMVLFPLVAVFVLAAIL
jgi:hypothetical protein